jgi:LacI family transcriptional regulator
MGYLGMEKLINKLNGEASNSHTEDVIFQMELIERDSTSKLD